MGDFMGLSTEAYFGVALTALGLHLTGAPNRVALGVPTFITGVVVTWRGVVDG
jgi:hypothetical protein